MYEIPCSTCGTPKKIDGVPQPGQNQSHYICEVCQHRVNMAAAKATLEREAPTVTIFGDREPQTITAEDVGDVPAEIVSDANATPGRKG